MEHALHAAIRLLGTTDLSPSLQALTTAFVNELVLNDPGLQARAIGAVPALIRIVRSSATSKEVRKIATVSLGILCKNSFAMQTRAAEAIPDLARLLLEKEEVEDACGAILALVEDHRDNKVRTILAGALPAMIRLQGPAVVHAVFGETTLSFNDIKALATHAECAPQVARSYLPKLARCLGADDVALQMEALSAIVAVVDRHGVADDALTKAMLPRVIEFLGSDNLGVQERAIVATWILAKNDDEKRHLSATVPALVRLLASSAASIRTKAAVALEAVTRAESVMKRGAVEALTSLLRCKRARV